ncbi:MAG: inositol monophosphatase [Sedimentisphaerales bacterium]|nr:inositol monophosphatase [Sedimentisphaerales bacterium]
MSLEHKELSGLLETALVAARLAGQHAMEHMDYVKATIKSDNEMVSQADAQCQKIIIDRIKETYPDHGFIGEEGPDGNLFKQPPRGDEKIWWVIDPIDGTNNYIRQVPLFCVCVAAVYENKPVVGVTFEPATERMYTAFEGGDAQLNGRKITASAEGINNFEHIGLDSHNKDSVPHWLNDLMIRTRFRNLGSAGLHFAYVANGGFIATIIRNVKIWDVASGAIIAESAGAVVTDFQSNPFFPLDIAAYNGEKLNIVCANKKVHSEIIRLINS